MKCATCGYDDRGTGDSAHVCRAASPVQGAAARWDNMPNAVEVLRSASLSTPVVQAATSSASVAKGAAVSDGDLLHLFDCYGNACYNRLSNQYDFRTRFLAALADRSPAVQPSGTVQALVVGVTPGMGRIEIEFGGDVPEWADLGLRIRIATPAPEQEAAPAEATKPACSFCHDTGKEWCMGGWGPDNYFDDEMDCTHCGIHTGTAPVPATTPAEQPEATADTLRAIRDEITGYYRALDSRQHGGVAQNKAFMAIESVLGMCWEAHRATATNTNQPEGEKGGAA